MHVHTTRARSMARSAVPILSCILASTCIVSAHRREVRYLHSLLEWPCPSQVKSAGPKLTSLVHRCARRREAEETTARKALTIVRMFDVMDRITRSMLREKAAEST